MGRRFQFEFETWVSTDFSVHQQSFESKENEPVISASEAASSSFEFPSIEFESDASRGKTEGLPEILARRVRRFDLQDHVGAGRNEFLNEYPERISTPPWPSMLASDEELPHVNRGAGSLIRMNGPRLIEQVPDRLVGLEKDHTLKRVLDQPAPESRLCVID
jgi:hypothetical protein